MKLLSRVADRAYWAGRYLERTNNSARLITVVNSLLLDLQEDTGMDWHTLIEITGSSSLAKESGVDGTAGSAAHFLVSSRENPGSIISSVTFARENMRTSRDIFPSEAWRCVNEMYLLTEAELGGQPSSRQRYDVLIELVERSHQLVGLLTGTMSHGDPYRFVGLGLALERADMTSRIIDVAAAALRRQGPELARYYNTLWRAVLRSVSGYQMYRQYVRRRLVADEVIGFLFKDERFPRSVAFCLRWIEHALRSLPRHEEPLVRLGPSIENVRESSFASKDAGGLHHWIDGLQIDLGEIHRLIESTWFRLERG